MTSNFTLPEHILTSPIDVLDLSTRSSNALQRAGLDKVGDLIGLSERDLLSIRGIGKVSAAELRRRLREYLANHLELTDGERADMLRPYIIQSPAKLLPSLVPLIEEILNAIQKPRYFEILRLHYGLQDCEPRSFQKIGDRYDISKQAVRQSEARALRISRGYLEGELESPDWRIPEKLIEEYRTTKQWAYSGDGLVTEDEVIELLGGERDDPVIDFLMKLLGLDLLPLHNEAVVSINVRKAWLVPGIRQATLCQVTRSVYHYLLDAIVPVSVADLAITLDVDRRHLDLAVKWCEDIERLPEGMVQVRFARLRSAADRAYRILHRHGEPMHIREITRRINTVDPVKLHTVGCVLPADDRFEPIGRTGQWTLACWEGICRETIIGLISEFLREKQDSAPVTEVAEYVKARRPDVTFSTVQISLYNRTDLFARTADGQFTLVDV